MTRRLCAKIYDQDIWRASSSILPHQWVRFPFRPPGATKWQGGTPIIFFNASCQKVWSFELLLFSYVTWTLNSQVVPLQLMCFPLFVSLFLMKLITGFWCAERSIYYLIDSQSIFRSPSLFDHSPVRSLSSTTRRRPTQRRHERLFLDAGKLVENTEKHERWRE